MPVYSHSYDSRTYTPAMPVADITLLSLVSGATVTTLVAIVDTGADATMLPIDALGAAGALFLQSRRLSGVMGQSQQVDTYLTTIQIGPPTVHGIHAVAVPVGGEAIIGRDVLNELEIKLNGPAQELWIE